LRKICGGFSCSFVIVWRGILSKQAGPQAIPGALVPGVHREVRSEYCPYLKGFLSILLANFGITRM
jgi:hypothetical protein